MEEQRAEAGWDYSCAPVLHRSLSDVSYTLAAGCIMCQNRHRSKAMLLSKFMKTQRLKWIPPNEEGEAARIVEDFRAHAQIHRRPSPPPGMITFWLLNMAEEIRSIDSSGLSFATCPRRSWRSPVQIHFGRQQGTPAAMKLCRLPLPGGWVHYKTKMLVTLLRDNPGSYESPGVFVSVSARKTLAVYGGFEADSFIVLLGKSTAERSLGEVVDELHSQGLLSGSQPETPPSHIQPHSLTTPTMEEQASTEDGQEEGTQGDYHGGDWNEPCTVLFEIELSPKAVRRGLLVEGGYQVMRLQTLAVLALRRRKRFDSSRLPPHLLEIYNTTL